MKTYKVNIYNENTIELLSSEDLKDLYRAIESEENFILQWEEKGITKSELIIATNIAGSIKLGEVKLTSKE